jgi:hypothetical protein
VAPIYPFPEDDPASGSKQVFIQGIRLFQWMMGLVNEIPVIRPTMNVTKTMIVMTSALMVIMASSF